MPKTKLSTLKLTRVRLEAGRGNELDTARAEAQWQTTLASIPTLEATIATTMYRLSVLTGRQPAALNERLTPQPAPELPPLNSIGTPELLLGGGRTSGSRSGASRVRRRGSASPWAICFPR